MITDIGYVALTIALVASIYGMLIPHLGVRQNNWNLVRSTQFATIVSFVLICIASVALLDALITSDFRLEYVAGHSSSDMPLFYKITAFWGGMEGSLLFWALVQSGFAMVAAIVYQKTNRELIPYVLSVLNGIMVFLLFLLVGWSNPLALLANVPLEGRGLNPLLQHPAMAFHPPALYLGYIGFSVPFAFAMAGLMRNKLDNEWVLTTRRWTLFSWYFLSVGLILGGQWAYEELGWGGYWAWDPVENAAFMPWLCGTAFLHSVMIQEKRNMLKIWNIVLIIITFGLSILGTFIVRSGVINSVHSFAQSEIGPAFLVFLAIVLFVGFTFLFYRLKELESPNTIESIVCKENVFLTQNILFVGIAFTVLLGTTFPLLAEAIKGTKLSIQAPFFNTITAPMGYAIFFLMGIGTLIAWRRSTLDNFKRNFIKPIVIATLGTMGLVFFIQHLEALLILWIAIFVTMTIVFEIAKATKTKSKQFSTNYLMGFFYVFMRNRRRYGGLLIHLGVVLMFIGFAGRFLDVEKDIVLQPNETAIIGSYELKFRGVESFQEQNVTHRAARIEVWQEGEQVDVLLPSKSFYPTQPNPLTEVAIRRTFWEDLYLIFTNENPANESASLKVHVNPLVGWAWMSLPMFTLGVGICFSYRPKTLALRKEFSSLSYDPSLKKS